MIKTEKDLLDIIETAQSGIYDKNAWLIRDFSGDMKMIVHLLPIVKCSIIYVR